MNKLIGITRSFSSSASLNAVKTVTVVGGGLMGSGIAQVAAQAGQNVTIIDVNSELLEKAQKSIQTNLTRVGKKLYKGDEAKIANFVKESAERIRVSTKLEDGADVDLIVEAIVEKLDAKQELFNKLDVLSPPRTIFATNTSCISVNAIGAGIQRKDRYGGLHFFNPVPVMRLLEVIKCDNTSEETYQTMMEWGKSVGKTCITCKDTPGFVVNRLLGPYSAEAIRMLERDGGFGSGWAEVVISTGYLVFVSVLGDATKEDIDIGMKLGAGLPMGPFELADYTGLDTNRLAQQALYSMTKNEVFAPIELLEKMVAEGKYGIKSGEGFYKYNKKPNGDASAEDIDVAIKLGAGYPMGPLELADFTGLDTKKFVLGVMHEKTGLPAFEPIALLNKLVSEGKFGRKTGEGFYKYDK
ncbi:hypothetical protein SFRURICE_004139 [Spodoptera frugiperda]|nr:hypothetical protein SFRURICE_004139 [Spodoptera frugiperda]